LIASAAFGVRQFVLRDHVAEHVTGMEEHDLVRPLASRWPQTVASICAVTALRMAPWQAAMAKHRI